MENNEIHNCIQIISTFPIVYKIGNQSPCKIMMDSKYSNLFPLIKSDSISKVISENPTLVEEWIKYSEDIRHSPAWVLEKDGNEIWKVSYWKNGKIKKTEKFNDGFMACAKMIKMTFEEIRNSTNV